MKSPRRLHNFAVLAAQKSGQEKNGMARERGGGRMRSILKDFARSEDGAITVDWVVLTALILGFQIALLMTPIREALVSVSEATSDQAAETGVGLDD